MNKGLFIFTMLSLFVSPGVELDTYPASSRPVSESVFQRVDEIANDIYNTPMEPTVIIEAEPAKPEYSDEEIELLALVTMAEAEGESEEGKRLVIDTILNRVDHWYYPDTIEGVIYQRGQFTSMWNGRASRSHVTDEVRQLVREELESRTNTDVIYFTAGGYGKYGTPLFQVGNHYFASY